MTSEEPSRSVGDRYLGAEGRLRSGPSDALASSAFSVELDAAQVLHPWMYYADVTHVLALGKAQYISADDVSSLVGGLRALRNRPASLIGWDPTIGDTYNNRDALLRDETPSAAALMSTGRSRRESMTVAWQLATRSALAEFSRSTTALASRLCKVADDHAATLTVDQTYLQHAHPTTLGHYFLGFAAPLMRSINRLATSAADLDRCPAGVGSVNGSRLDLQREYQSDMLGWEAPFDHVRDAMWASDIPIAIAAEVTAALISADRLAEELLLWATAEFDLVSLADEHCRASVVMPHKKNPYGLAHLRGLARRSLGELGSVAATQLSVSGQPDNRTYCYETMVPALGRATAALRLMDEILDRCEFNTTRMHERAHDRFVSSTDIADYLSATYGTPNRVAHRVIGRVVRSLLDGPADQQITCEHLQAAAADLSVDFPLLEPSELNRIKDPAEVIAARHRDGEASTESVRRLAMKWSSQLEDEHPAFARWEQSITTYDARVDHTLQNGF